MQQATTIQTTLAAMSPEARVFYAQLTAIQSVQSATYAALSAAVDRV